MAGFRFPVGRQAVGRRSSFIEIGQAAQGRGEEQPTILDFVFPGDAGDITLAFQRGVDFCVANQRTLLVPAGVYDIGPVTNSVVKRLSIVGDGSATTVLRRKPGLVTVATPSSRMLTLENANATNASLSVSGLTFDGNGRAQGLPVGEFDFQQSHSALFRSRTVRGFQSIQIRDVVLIDTVADGISLSGNAGRSVGTVNISDVQARDRTFTRSDICLTAPWDECNISNFVGDALEVEPNGIDVGFRYSYNLVNATVRQRLDIYLKGGVNAGQSGPCLMTNVNAESVEFLNLREFDFHFQNCLGPDGLITEPTG